MSLARSLAVGAAVGVVLVVVLGLLGRHPATVPGSMSDALGPEHGEPVGVYLDRAAASLRPGGEGTGDDDRWALLTWARATGADDAARTVAAAPRVSRLLVQTPVDQVAMPVAWVDLPEPGVGDSGADPGLARAAVFRAGLDRLAERADARAAHAGSPREQEVEQAFATRLRAGEPAIVGVVVRATSETCRGLAGASGVRAVEALPADAVWGRFAVRPLLPQQTERADPLPDTGTLADAPAG